MFRERFDPQWRFALFDPWLPISTTRNLLCARFATMAEIHGLNYGEFMKTVPSTDGFTMRHGKNYIIVYNDAPHIPYARKRFTVAHELGHVVLRHQRNGEAEECEADTFARNLLAPRRLALKYGIDFRDYPSVFGISAAAARMCERYRTLDEQYGVHPISKSGE